MAKESKYSPVLLFVISVALLMEGSIWPLFPIGIFFGFAPLFALTDRVNNTENVWERMEWVLIALAIYFFLAFGFDLSLIVHSMVYAIVFTIPFIGYVWVRQTLGDRVGKIIIILFWLALEYGIYKIFPDRSQFLTDILSRYTDWMQWNIYTGFMGGSLWILMVNLIAYYLFFSEQPFKWYWIVLAIVFLAGPIAYSFILDYHPIVRSDMFTTSKDVTYLANGEVTGRTAAWISVLILLYAFVKSQTKQR
ncbi:MAG: hypothetical protein HOP08_07270 [Cyclobacteriaceae bacterium]|nr:hypothetical protein [Cyclobacteriaceae bacterium]